MHQICKINISCNYGNTPDTVQCYIYSSLKLLRPGDRMLTIKLSMIKISSLNQIFQLFRLLQPLIGIIILLLAFFDNYCMKARIIFCLIIALLILQACGETPRLPLYVGRSYDLLSGNPLSDQVDPGFDHSIFQFTYNKKETTQDGKYLVPDGVSHRKVSSCTFSTNIQTYRGTKSYQDELKSKATINGEYKGAILDAAFSASNTYEAIQKSTIESNMSITHATASCEAYELSIDIFTINTLLPNFVSGVNESYHSKNWNKFINQFGTHFVYDVTMGGRATQEIRYSFQSSSKLSSLDIDITLAAKASFAKFFMDGSFDWHKHEEEIAYSEQMSTTTTELYIGGQPPKDGSIHSWADRVIQNPMPIKYKVIQLSQLFSNIKDKTINITEAVQQYHSALDSYCQSLNCRKPTPDRPKPPPATVVQARSHAYGGEGGTPFQFYFESTTINAVKMLIKHGSMIDSLQIELGDGVKKMYTPVVGGKGGYPVQWQVPADQYITQIEYRATGWMDSITFVTNKGIKSPYFGGGGGDYHLETFPEGYRIIGFYGRSSDRVDKLGFILGKTVFPTYGPPKIDIIRKQLNTE